MANMGSWNKAKTSLILPSKVSHMSAMLSFIFVTALESTRFPIGIPQSPLDDKSNLLELCHEHLLDFQGGNIFLPK